MKIIQSFWSKPFLKSNQDETLRFEGGWLNANFFLYSCLLSCLKFKEHYGNVSLYTDDYGKKLLVDTFEIPYSHVKIALNAINHYPSELWALGKILTYSLQNRPFIHADTDVFIWEKFSKHFTNSLIFAQNIELNFPKYKEVLEIIQTDFVEIPDKLLKKTQSTDNIMAFNAGIIGGNDIQFFKDFASLIFPFIDANLDKLDKISVGDFNMVFEQMFGMNLANQKGIEVNFLRNHMNESFSGVMKFHLIPIKENYIHTVGYAKKSIQVCEQIQARLQYEYPEEYKKLNIQILKHKSFSGENIEISEKRRCFIFKIYDWLKNKKWTEMISTSFILNPECSFEELVDGSSIIHYSSPQNQNNEKTRIEDWDFILGFFEKPTTTLEVVNELMLNKDLSENFTFQQLSEKVFSFVMDRCLYHEILILADK
jgi:hypothetical protein